MYNSCNFQLAVGQTTIRYINTFAHNRGQINATRDSQLTSLFSLSSYQITIYIYIYHSLSVSRTIKAGLPTICILLCPVSLKGRDRFSLTVRPVSGRTSVRYRFGSPFSSNVVVCGHCPVTLSLTINETLTEWLSSLPILMQESFWW